MLAGGFAVAQELRAMKPVILKPWCRLFRNPNNHPRALHSHTVGSEFALPFYRRCDRHALCVVSECDGYPHTIKFSHLRFWVRMREELRPRLIENLPLLLLRLGNSSQARLSSSCNAGRGGRICKRAALARKHYLHRSNERLATQKLSI